LKCVDSLTHRNICWYNKGRLLYNLFLFFVLFVYGVLKIVYKAFSLTL